MSKLLAAPLALVAQLLGGALLCAQLAMAGDVSLRVPQPVIEPARGGQCVEDPAFMRRNHMELLKHQRDNTVRGGVRTGKYKLQECVACHASSKTNSVTQVSTNFCQSCHTYAAVKIDCFECHASKPADTGFHPVVSKSMSENHQLTMQLRQLVVQQSRKP